MAALTEELTEDMKVCCVSSLHVDDDVCVCMCVCDGVMVCGAERRRCGKEDN